MLLKELSSDPQVVARFNRECGTVVGLEHASAAEVVRILSTLLPRSGGGPESGGAPVSLRRSVR